jgi:AcrR family transcriptional regulator
MATVKSTASARSTRREQARQSRLRILRAAREAFAARGYHGATMTEIAEASGLAVQTVSYFFGTKPRLLGDLIGAVVTGAIDDDPADPGTSRWFTEAITTRDGRTALGSLVDGGLPVFARSATVADVARVASLTDPDVAEVYRSSETLRHREFGRIVRALAEHGNLREDLTVELGTDVLSTVFSPQVYLACTLERGWSDEQTATWLKDALPRLLLTPAALK